MKRTQHLVLLLGLWVASIASVAIAEDHHGHGHDERGHGHEEAAIDLAVERFKHFGVSVEEAGPRQLRMTLTLAGRIVPDEDRVAHIIPRFPGTIREVRKRLGDPVEKGEAVALIESNQNLQPYEVRSQIAGMVTNRHATLGEFVSEGRAIFEVADYSELFADFFVFPEHFHVVRIGQQVLVGFHGQTDLRETTVSFISPVVDQETQSRFVRVHLTNGDGALHPGAYVTGDLVTNQTGVSVAVRNSALQTLRGQSAVFVQQGNSFESRHVVTGRQDPDYTEIRSGLKPGERYAFGKTFLLKAEAGKGEAEHKH